MRRLLQSYLAWEIALSVIGAGACLVPTIPRTGAFWGTLKTWMSIAPDKVLIDSVSPGSPADAAGLKAGDWVIAVDGRRPVDYEALDRAMKGMRPASEVELRVERDGQERTLKVVGWEPQAEAVEYQDGQVVTLLVCAVLGLFLVVTQPLRPTPWWRPLAVVVVGFAGAALLVLGLARPGEFGWSGTTWIHFGQAWDIDNEPDLPRLAVQGVCLAVAVGLVLVGTLEVRGVVQRKVAERALTAGLGNLGEALKQGESGRTEAGPAPSAVDERRLQPGPIPRERG